MSTSKRLIELRELMEEHADFLASQHRDSVSITWMDLAVGNYKRFKEDQGTDRLDMLLDPLTYQLKSFLKSKPTTSQLLTAYEKVVALADEIEALKNIDPNS